MKQYLDLGRRIVAKYDDVMEDKAFREDRTGTGTVSIFGPQFEFNMENGFPLMTSKFVPIRLVGEELIWIKDGETNNNILTDKNVHIWDEWAVEDGGLGPIYGSQWRRLRGKCIGMKNVNPLALDGASMRFNGEPEYEYHDQLKTLMVGLQARPFSRRHIIDAWTVPDLPDESMSPQDNVRAGRMALAPCHTLVQFYVEKLTLRKRRALAEQYRPRFSDPNAAGVQLDLSKGGQEGYAPPEAIEKWLDDLGVPRLRLSSKLYQRSADFILGVPFNIASYALLTSMIAHCLHMLPGDFIHTFGDCHIYSNHIEKFKAEQMDREPMPLPTLVLNPDQRDIYAFTMDDVKVENYSHHPKINYGGVAV